MTEHAKTTEYAKMPQDGEIQLLATMHRSAIVMEQGSAPKVSQVNAHYADPLGQIADELGPRNGTFFAYQYDTVLIRVALRDGSKCD